MSPADLPDDRLDVAVRPPDPFDRLGRLRFADRLGPRLNPLEVRQEPAADLRAVGRPDRLAGQRQVDGVPEPEEAYPRDESSDRHPPDVGLQQDLGGWRGNTEELAPERHCEIAAGGEPDVRIL